MTYESTGKFTPPNDEERPDSHLALVLNGNEFAVLSFLQHAQLHLMRSTGCKALHVSLNGDYAAILKLQSAENEVMAWAMTRAGDRMAELLSPKELTA